MKRVYYVSLSSKPEDIETGINDAIAKIEHDYTLDWLTDLFIAPDASKFQLVFEQSGTVGTDEPSIGVKVVAGSQNMHTTEELLNEAFLELSAGEDKGFLNIFHPSEFVYIILYENKAGEFPRVKITPNPAEPKIGGVRMSNFFQFLDDDEEWDLQPYECIMLDKNNMLILFAEA